MLFVSVMPFLSKCAGNGDCRTSGKTFFDCCFQLREFNLYLFLGEVPVDTETS